MRLSALVLAAVGAGLGAAGCGGGSVSYQSTNSSGGVSFAGALVTRPAALVATDVDGDGKTDLVAMDRAGAGDVKCWKNMGGGAYADATTTWTADATVASVKDSCDAQDDASLVGDLGVHMTGCPTGGTLPYAVMHLGAGVKPPSGPPIVDAVEPSSGPTKSLAWIEGADLAATGEPPAVTFDGTAADVLLAFPDYVLVVVPAALPLGPVDVVLTRGGLASSAARFTVTAAPAPHLDAVSPSSVMVGTVAVLSGTDLGSPFDAVTVSFAGTPSEHAVALSQVAFAVVPSGALSGPVTITVNGVASNPIEVAVGALPAPALTSVSPASASPGSLVRIEGDNLFVIGQAVDVSFAGTPAAIFGFDGSSCTAIVPPGATDGDVVVAVGGRASNGVAFDVVPRGTPHIASVTPASAAAGEPILVKGTDLCDLSAWAPNAIPPFPFFGNLHVTVGGLEAWLVIPTADGLDVLVPFGAPNGDVVVTVNGVASNAFAITLN